MPKARLVEGRFFDWVEALIDDLKQPPGDLNRVEALHRLTRLWELEMEERDKNA